MLDALRASSQTWFGRTIMAVVMGLLVIAFGFWGIADIFRGFGANSLARVGSTEITVEADRNAYQHELLNFSKKNAARSAPMKHVKAASTAKSWDGCSAMQRSIRRPIVLDSPCPTVTSPSASCTTTLSKAQTASSTAPFEERLRDDG